MVNKGFMRTYFWGGYVRGGYLEDHPMTCKWLYNNHGDRLRPQDLFFFPFPNGLLLDGFGGKWLGSHPIYYRHEVIKAIWFRGV